VLCSALLDLMIVAFYFFIRISVMTQHKRNLTSPVATVGIGELSPSKFKYETLQISKDFIKLSECQVPLRKFKLPIQDFWRRF